MFIYVGTLQIGKLLLAIIEREHRLKHITTGASFDFSKGEMKVGVCKHNRQGYALKSF